MNKSDPSQVRIEDREDALRLLTTSEISLPDGLTVRKIRERGAWWQINKRDFSFRLERHPSPLLAASIAGGPTPARWHIRTRYRYHPTSGEWEVAELTREFSFDATLLIDYVFERGATRELWQDAVARIQASDDPETAFSAEFNQFVESYREQWHNVPTEKRTEMLAVLEQAARRRADIAEVDSE